jgi:hypothetical protein
VADIYRIYAELRDIWSYRNFELSNISVYNKHEGLTGLEGRSDTTANKYMAVESGIPFDFPLGNSVAKIIETKLLLYEICI